MSREAAPRPWRAYVVAGLVTVVDANGNKVNDYTQKESAELTVKAVNAYDAMLHALGVAYHTAVAGRAPRGVDLVSLIADAIRLGEDGKVFIQRNQELSPHEIHD